MSLAITIAAGIAIAIGALMLLRFVLAVITAIIVELFCR